MSKKTESYIHRNLTRKNNPEVGLSVYDKDKMTKYVALFSCQIFNIE